jgi:hypothetical protein
MKISQYPSNSTPAGTDTLLGDDSTPTTKRYSLANLITFFFNNIPSQAITVAANIQRVKRVTFNKGSDGAGGVSITQTEASEITFTGTPSEFGRLDVLMPMDYVAGTTATVHLIGYSASVNNQELLYYLSSHAVGSTFSSWNIQNSVVTSTGIGMNTANVIVDYPLFTIPAADLAAGSQITSAFRPNTAVTGTVLFTEAYLSYTGQ